jgi:hypothetical protein
MKLIDLKANLKEGMNGYHDEPRIEGHTSIIGGRHADYVRFRSTSNIYNGSAQTITHYMSYSVKTVSDPNGPPSEIIFSRTSTHRKWGGILSNLGYFNSEEKVSLNIYSGTSARGKASCRHVADVYAFPIPETIRDNSVAYRPV